MAVKKSNAGLIFILISLIVYGASPLVYGEDVVVTDATGQKLSFSSPPKRIVSLNPDFTWNICALGSGAQLVGITDYCRYPESTPRPVRLGNLWQPNLEHIVALSPDLVFATKEGNNPGIISVLREMGIPVYVNGESTGFRDYFKLLSRLGDILGRSEVAEELIERTTTRINNLRAEAASRAPATVFLQIGIRPIVTVNRDTLINEMIEIAGGDNIAAGLTARYPVISREKVLTEDPEVIIVAAMGSEAEAGLAAWYAFPELRAVRAGRIFVINPDIICRLSPRLQDGLEEIYSCLHGNREGQVAPVEKEVRNTNIGQNQIPESGD
jgi:iron complex transport system substrate-binding protein